MFQFLTWVHHWVWHIARIYILDLNIDFNIHAAYHANITVKTTLSSWIETFLLKPVQNISMLCLDRPWEVFTCTNSSCSIRIVAPLIFLMNLSIHLIRVSEFALTLSISAQTLRIRRPPVSFKGRSDMFHDGHFSLCNAVFHLDHQPNTGTDSEVDPDPVVVAWEQQNTSGNVNFTTLDFMMQIYF